MFLTDFRMRKYTGGIILRVGIVLTVTLASGLKPIQKIHMDFSAIEIDFYTHTHTHVALKYSF